MDYDFITALHAAAWYLEHEPVLMHSGITDLDSTV